MCDNKIVNDDKLYKTKNGYDVVFYAFYPEQNRIHGAYFVRGEMFNSASWTLDTGMFTSGNNSEFNLVKDEPYRDFKIDDLVRVIYADGEEGPLRYFAGLDKKGNPMTFDGGTTSKTFSSRSTWTKVIKVDI